jgi:hypothetical protein
MGEGYFDYQSKISNSSYSGGGGRRIKVQGQPRQMQEILPEKQTEKAKGLGRGSSGRELA